VHVISADAQRYRHRKCKVILGPAACALHAWPAGKKYQKSKHLAAVAREEMVSEHSTTVAKITTFSLNLALLSPPGYLCGV